MTALVTGAAGAIGSAIVEQLLALGETVIAQDITFRTPVAPGVRTIEGDLLAAELHRELIDAIGGEPLHRVIAAHGVDGSAALRDATPEFFRRVMRINGETVPLLLESTRAGLRAASGTFMIVSSQAGIVAERENLAYSASKFALIGWARALRSELAAEGIRIRVLAPGCTETPLFVAAQERFAAMAGMPVEQFLQVRRDRIPVGRFASTAQTAAGAVYLSDPAITTPFLLAATGGEVRH
jgi:NAD(P)-dependent dehydrogenase (short-subunit alcohol dehydrogenase family)